VRDDASVIVLRVLTRIVIVVTAYVVFWVAILLALVAWRS
jgi:hypothetical protein